MFDGHLIGFNRICLYWRFNMVVGVGLGLRDIETNMVPIWQLFIIL